MLLFYADLVQIEVRGPQSKRGTHIKLCDPEVEISLPECRETNFAMGNNVRRFERTRPDGPDW